MEHFFTLTPDKILDSIELALDSKKTGVRATGRTIALNSMENRVYEIELDDGKSVVAKFYRPGRWSKTTILEEHRFVIDLLEAEIPAVAPLALANGSTLAETDDGIPFAIFEKTRGRILQELSDAQLQRIGRFLARLHNVGEKASASHRIRLNTKTYGEEALAALETKKHIPALVAPRYAEVVKRILARVAPLIDGAVTQRIHGDCHLGNVLWNNDSPFFIDFDDMCVGPCVQDIWLVVRGRDELALKQRETLLSSYEQLRDFDRSTFRLVEPLRALRMIHYAGWISRRYEDPTFQNAFPEFQNERFWLGQWQDLEEQWLVIDETANQTQY